METTLSPASYPDRHAGYLSAVRKLRDGQPVEACGLLRRALQVRPDDANIRRDLIRALLASEQFTEMLGQVAVALVTMPDDAELHFAQGTALSALRCPAAARPALTRAVVLRPNWAAGWLNLGNVCADLDDLEDAERHCRTAIRLDPSLAAAHVSLGHLLHVRGALEDAITSCETAVRLAPNLPQAHWNLGTTLLLAGDMPRGLREYEWRKQHPAYRTDFPPLPGPYWSGGDPAGKVILVRAEQGFGDTIQFSRYLLDIVGRGGAPVLLCDPSLVPLLSVMPGVVVLSRTARVEGYDTWTDLMSLPLAVGGTICPDFYLQPDPARVLAWRGRSAAGFRVGVAWAGNPAQANDRRRSIPAPALAPLLALPGVSFVNLQVGARAKEAGLPDLSHRLTDYAETAALIATLDLVIAVDSSVAHLAGALGAPVWVLLAHVPDWRWLLGRDDSPWYSSARLFRQQAPGDWNGVIRRVGEALDQKRSSP